MATFQYDPKSVVITYGGVPLSGFADGTFIKITSNEDDFALKVGADGEGCRVRKRNGSAKVELSLLQSSLSNTLLSTLRLLDIESPLGTGAKVLSIITASGSNFTMPEAWIVKMPDIEYSKDVEHRAWMFEATSLVAVITGDVPLAPIV